MKHTFHVSEEYAKARLDVFLSEHIPDLSRSAIAKLLKAGAGSINDKPAAVHTFVKTGDIIEFNAELNDTQNKTIEHADQKPKFNLKKIIVKETPDFIVVNKPAGLIVHPDSKHKTHTLIDLLMSHCPAIAKIGEDPSRPGIVHRIDKDVSGLMVVAKNQKAFDNLKQQFKDRKTHKKYFALVYGTLPAKTGEIKFRIARSTSKASMAALPENSTKGKAAWSHYQVIKEPNHLSLVELDIISGRTHQIRVHLNALKHPVVGDTLYKQKQYKPIPATRLMLQSHELSFLDPATNDPLTFNIPLDPAINQLVESNQQVLTS